MKDIAIEWEIYSTNNIKLIISGRDINELFQELKVKGFNPKKSGEYEFTVRVNQEVFNELEERF